MKSRRILHKLRLLRDRFFYCIICKFCCVRRTKAFFSSFLGKSYSDNPRAISEKLHELYPQFVIVWQFKKLKQEKLHVPYYVKSVRCNSLAALFHQTTSAIWVDNYCKSTDTNKRTGQYYIQTWHGDRGLKKVLADMQANKDGFDLFESEHCNLMVSGSEFGEKVYRSSFMYNGEILKTGCPRNDILINGDSNAVSVFRLLYNIPINTKVLLYAPTFRDSNKSSNQQVVDVDFDKVLDSFEDKTGQEWCLIFRGHTGRHLVFSKIKSHKTIDVTDYEDTKIVLLSSDAVISDYSTVATDFAILMRPVFLFINDIDDYLTNDRQLWYPMSETPFWYAKNQNELISLIQACTVERAINNCKAILDFYKTYEKGNASEEVCKRIIEFANREENK